MSEISIAGRKVGDGHKPFIVAEVGLNHNGDVMRALMMAAEAKMAGCDAVKFATFKADEFCQPSDPLYPWFKKAELPDGAWREIKDFCDKTGIIFFSTPQNESDLKLLLDVGVPCIKIGSDDLTNLTLIEAYAKYGKPLILSIGMADAWDIRHAVHTAGEGMCVVCVCTSEYPCPPEHANLARIITLRQVYRGDMPIGFSDHTVGPQAATVAAALRATYFEKHFTLAHSLPGPDHRFSATPSELSNWAWSIRNATTMLGGGELEPTEAEKVNRVNWRRKSGQQIRGVAA